MDREKLVGLGIEWGFGAARMLPEAVADRIFRLGADRMLRTAGPSVRQLAHNLGRVLRFSGAHGGPPFDRPSFELVMRAALRSYARYWKETVRLESMDVQAIGTEAIATCQGLEYLRAPVEAGRGVVLAVPHSGNWDVSGLIAVRLYGGLSTVAERLKPESLFRRFLDHRTAIGMEVLPLTGSDVNPTTVLMERLRAGGIVCLPADRDLSGSGIEVDFFGARTTMPPGPAMLAARTGADLCSVEINFGPDPDAGTWRNVISPPIPLTGARLRDTVTAGTQAIATAFERSIALAPADWHMMQPLWLDDPAHRGRPNSSRGSTAGTDTGTDEGDGTG